MSTEILDGLCTGDGGMCELTGTVRFEVGTRDTFAFHDSCIGTR